MALQGPSNLKSNGDYLGVFKLHCTESIMVNSFLGTLLPQSASPEQHKGTRALEKPLGRRCFERMNNTSCPTGCQASPVMSHTNTKTQ